MKPIVKEKTLRETLAAGNHLEKHVVRAHFGVKFGVFIRSYIAMLCCHEYFIFNAVLSSHDASTNATLGAWLPSYTIKQWSDGKFSDDVILLSSEGLSSLHDLRAWARDMIAFNSTFDNFGIFSPVKWLKTKGLITPQLAGLSWQDSTDSDLQTII